MHPEHKRPLAAFVLVTATSAVLLSQALFAAPSTPDAVRPASSGASSESTASPTGGSPANGHAVDGVTASPTDLPVVVKTIGRPPTIIAFDEVLDVSTGAIEDPAPTAPPKAGGTGPAGGQPSTPPEPTPTGEPDPGEGQPDEDQQGGRGPKVNPPSGPWHSPELPPIGPGGHGTPSGPASHTP